jgi:hypothetical protein
MLAKRGRQPNACMGSAVSRTRSNVALAIMLALIALACAASSASAESWGQVGKGFSLAAGKEAGQIDESGLVRFAAGSDGSYYVLTEVPRSGKLILQRFVEGKLQAKAELKGEEEVSDGAREGIDAILAVDPARNRVYVLLVYERREPTEHEENKEEFPLDDAMPAAGALYAFEYNSEKKELIKKPKLSRKELKGEGELPKEALLDPRGIAVDPVTGDLAISGNQDGESDEKVEHGAEKQCRAAVQFVTVKSVESGTKKGQIESVSPGARYVDSAGKLLFGQTGCGEEEEEEAIGQAPASPAYAPDGALLGYSEEEVSGPEGVIWQLAPAGADTAHTSGEFTMAPKELFVAESLPAFEPETGDEQPASVMSLVPESATDGTIYLSGDYINNQPAPAVLHYHSSGGEPSIAAVGWTAGGSVESGTQRPGPCDLHKGPTSKPIMLGGLSGPKRGYLALTFYKEYEHEVEVKRAEVVEFGEGGKTEGCPTVPVTTPTQKLNGEPVHEVPAGTPVQITSVLGTVEGTGETIHAAAGATSVRWTVKFTSPKGSTEVKHYPETGEEHYEYDGLHEVEPSYGVKLKLDQTFTQVGDYEITDEVHTDDLAHEEVTRPAVTDKLIVTPGKLKVRPETPTPATVRAHEEAAELKVEAKVEGQEKLDVKKVVWEYPSEGTKEEAKPNEELPNPAQLSVTHTFSRCSAAKSAKCKIKVTVEAETAEGKTEVALAQDEITVEEGRTEQKEREEKEQREAKEHEGGGGGSGGGGGGSGSGSGGGSGSSSGGGSGGVAGYIASFTGSSLRVNAGGATAVKITCPSGGSCSGRLTLQTLNAVAARNRHSRHSRKKILTLASGAFSLSGGSRSVTLHLNSTAKALLRRSHGVLRAKLTILSRGAAGQKNDVTTHILTLRLLVKKTKSHKH